MLYGVVAQAQSSPNIASDTIQWNYASIRNLTNNDLINESGHFVSYGSQSLRWIQDGFNNPYTFEITGFSGSWTDLGTDGTVIFNVACNGVSGTLRIYRENAVLQVHLDMGEAGALTPHLLITISAYNKV